MTFRATVRDNRAGGGGIDTAAVQVLVDGNSGPFAITAPETAVTWAGNSFQTVTWDTANTDSAPVSAANVRILLSTDGGMTFPTVISANTPNDGTQQIRVPNVETTQGRIKIQGVDKIFFDINGADLTINKSAAPVGTRFDFDGDNKADISVFRRSLGEFWYLRSVDGLDGAFAFGSPTDIPVPGDFTGDGIADFSFWRPSTGEWFILRSDNTGFFSGQFGATGDIPAPGDFDGDGTDDLAVFRPATGTWFIQRSSDNQTDFVQFGAPADLPLVGDYDNDGKDDVAIYKPDVSQFWQIRSTQGLAAFAFGAPGDTAMAADFSGDGTDDMVLFRPATGFWFVLRSEDSNFFGFPFGTSGDIPAPGDYDGDGTADPTVFRPSSTTWFSQQSTNGATFTPFGIATDEPLPAAYNAP
jgi:hypothetical protein